MSGYTSAIMVGVSLVSAAVGTVGAVQSANAQKQQTEYQSDMAEYNAKVAEGNAQLAEAEGKEIQKEAYEDSLSKRQEAASIVGMQRAQQGASGAQVDVGSSLDLNLDTTEKGELDALAIQEQGDWAAHAKRIDAWNHRNQASTDLSTSQMYSSKAAQVSPFLEGTQSLLAGVKQVGTSYGKHIK